jgi:hypothetical protein
MSQKKTFTPRFCDPSILDDRQRRNLNQATTRAELRQQNPEMEYDTKVRKFRRRAFTRWAVD